MKSIRAKIILLIMSFLIMSITILGSAGILSTKKVIESYSAQYMNLECTNTTAMLNETLEKIEQSVDTLSCFAKNRIDNTNKLIDNEDYLNDYISDMKTNAKSCSHHTDGAVAVYMRFNPEYWSTTTGFFLTRDSSDGSMKETEITDLELYHPDDTNRVGWYYLPVQAGKATWIEPYLNENIDIYMISYVIPIYKDDILIGVIGMDIDFSVFTSYVADITIYESGYAFLVNSDADTLYHHTVPEGISLGTAGKYLEDIVSHSGNGTYGNHLISYKNSDNEARKMAIQKLNNDVYLALTAPEKEINRVQNRLFGMIIAAGVTIIVAALIVTIIITRKLTKPILELNAAAHELTVGNLDVSVKTYSKDEIGTLTESFRKTVHHLREYISYINGLAYIDNMTGVKNKTAYKEAVEKLESRLGTEDVRFGVAVFDVNNLKKINDNYGHEAGDKLIIGSSNAISRTLSESVVYRIGGDEFAVILENNELEKAQSLHAELAKNIAEINNCPDTAFAVSVACGYAEFDKNTDKSFSDVFKRADEAMYRNKSEIKRKSQVK